MQRFFQAFMASIILCGCTSAPKSNAIDYPTVAICESQNNKDCSSSKSDIEPITNTPQKEGKEGKEGESSKARSKIEDAAIWVVAIPAIIIAAFVICPFKILSNSDNDFC